MASLLAIDFTFPNPGPRQSKSSLPEIQLISLVVIAVKLYHPFDSHPRHLRSLSELGTLTIDWDIWCKSQTEYVTRHKSTGKLGRGNEVNVNEKDIMGMSGEQLDEYLDWYEKTWVKDEPQEPNSRGPPQQILDMFPTGRPDGSSPAMANYDQDSKDDRAALNQKLKTVEGSLKLRGIVSGESEEKGKKPVRRIGSFYKRYRTIEDLSPQAKVFYDAAACSVGASIPTLVLSVFRLEKKLEAFHAGEETEDEDEVVPDKERHLESDDSIPILDEGQREIDEIEIVEDAEGDAEASERRVNNDVVASPNLELLVPSSTSDLMDED